MKLPLEVREMIYGLSITPWAGGIFRVSDGTRCRFLGLGASHTTEKSTLKIVGDLCYDGASVQPRLAFFRETFSYNFFSMTDYHLLVHLIYALERFELQKIPAYVKYNFGHREALNWTSIFILADVLRWFWRSTSLCFDAFTAEIR